MGDSLTDKRHWANREVAWVDLLRDALKREFGALVTIVNPAIGGTQLRQNVILIPRWLASAPEPDLVILFFGGNDWDAGMRGEEFYAAYVDAVDRVRQATNGRSDVLIVTTNPSAARWARSKSWHAPAAGPLGIAAQALQTRTELLLRLGKSILSGFSFTTECI